YWLKGNVSEGPLNARLTLESWTALNRGDYEQAIAKADECIRIYVAAANELQTQLQNVQAPQPDPGRPQNDEEKNSILRRGPLNDVATAFFIKGRAAEALGRRDLAIQAYQSALKYSYARCWDPKGWFWSP